MKLIPILPSLVTLVSVLNLAYGQSSSPPTLTAPSPIPPSTVGAYYDLSIPTTGGPVTYDAKHLPPGLSLDDETGAISGTPSRYGTFHVSIRAENEAGKSNKIEFDIEVAPVPADLVGSYHGYVFASKGINGNMGSRLELRTTSSGSATGKIITVGETTLHFTGSLVLPGAEATLATLDVIIPRPGDTPLTFQAVLDGFTNSLAGNLMDEAAEDPFEGLVAFNGWRNVWSSSNQATAYDTLHTFRLETMEVEPIYPLGYGFGSITLANANTGTVHVVGKTSDNHSFTTSTFLGPQYGEVLIYQGLYGNEGAIGGCVLVLAGATPGDNTVSGTLEWNKRPAPGDRLYPNGFAFDPDGNIRAMSVMAEGGAYPVPAPGGLVMGLPEAANNAQVSFLGGGLDAEGAEFGEIFTISNPGSGLDNDATFPPNVNKVEIPTLHAATGTFSGDFTLPAAPGVAKRKAPFQGQIVKIGDTVAGYGFFLLPEVPEGGETAHTSPKNSGKVVMQAAE